MRQRAFAAFKVAVYGLLAINVALFFRAGLATDLVPHKALDQIGWLILLGVFEWETRMLARGAPVAAIFGWPLAVELTGYAFAGFALWRYWQTAAWLDVGNSIAWLAISAMIWLDILRPADHGGAAFRWRSAAKLTLYAAVFGFAIAWGVEGDGLDFYDAVLWILCFFVIEVNVLRFDATPRLRSAF